MNIVIDSSVLIALLVPNDHWHKQAAALWNSVEASKYISVYFDCVAAEAVSAAVRRLHEKRLANEVDTLFKQLHAKVPVEQITWLLPDVPRLYEQIIALMRSSAGVLNFNDALIALACKEREIPVIASFDADFDQVDWLQRWARPEDVRVPKPRGNMR